MKIGHEKALAEMLELNELGVRLVIMEMLKTGKLKFDVISKEYVRHLESLTTEQSTKISTLSLHLGLCAGNDNSPFAKQGRKYLFENKLYHGADGSFFGKQLEDEFGLNNNPSG